MRLLAGALIRSTHQWPSSGCNDNREKKEEEEELSSDDTTLLAEPVLGGECVLANALLSYAPPLLARSLALVSRRSKP